MVNDDESMGVYSSIGGYFIWAQVGHCANRIKRVLSSFVSVFKNR